MILIKVKTVKRILVVNNLVWLIISMLMVIQLDEEKWRHIQTQSDMKDIKAQFEKCNGERIKVNEILKGDSLKTLLYW